MNHLVKTALCVGLLRGFSIRNEIYCIISTSPDWPLWAATMYLEPIASSLFLPSGSMRLLDAIFYPCPDGVCDPDIQVYGEPYVLD